MRVCYALLVLLGLPAAVVDAASLPLLEVSVDGQRYEGAPVLWNNQQIWWLGRDGRMQTFDLGRVTSYRKLSSEFRSYTSSEMRTSLLEEFPGYTVTGTGHYLVCHSPRTGAGYAQFFEDIYRAFTHYFTVRGFTVEPPRFPLVAVLLPDRNRFVQYAAHEGMQVPRSVVGYYLSQSNRIALYDVAGSASAPELRNQIAATIVHEVTHQVAFNTGLHDRFAQNPLWVVEGLAMLFEAPGVWNPRDHPNPASRLNRERLDHFRRYAAGRRKAGSLKSFLTSDDPFRTPTLDAYSEAWALTYFLVETRSARYADYLHRLAARKRGDEYTASERLADFQQAFGEDLDLLEARFLRYIDSL